MTEFAQYQGQTAQTAVYPDQNGVGGLYYLTMGLAGEAGEVASKVAKSLRDQVPLDKAAVAAELGDCLWFISQISTWLDVELNEVAAGNISKLLDRQRRGKLGGSGDNR